MRTLATRAPTRIDFGGGWTDVPPYPAEQGGVVCNVAIDRYAKVRLADEYGAVVNATGDGHDHDPALVTAALRRADLYGIRVSLDSDFPVGAGLGGSSAVGVALAGAAGHWIGRADSAEQLAEQSHAIEVEDLQIAGGRQDHYAAAFGGALHLRFEGDATHVRRILLTREIIAAFERRVIVGYTGQSRISAVTVTAVLEAYRARQPRVVAALARMKEIATLQASALARGNLDELGQLVREHWQHQRALHPAITTPLIDRVVEHATRAGALGVKALGASGGGCIVAIAADGREDTVREAVGALTELLDFRFAERGFEVIEEAELTTPQALAQ